ncbi:hypothetical protein [Zavarzinia sp. CC-PAN008]|uniref:hypothetical protein n=1 Tax=Zavarzinia sp. CC-PAN008 TaxID=3243332 RepID=UPI003F745032
MKRGGTARFPVFRLRRDRPVTAALLCCVLALQLLLMGVAMGRGAALAAALPALDGLGPSLEQSLCVGDGAGDRSPAKMPGASDCCGLGCALATGATFTPPPRVGRAPARWIVPAPQASARAPDLRQAGAQGIRGPPARA